MKKLIYGSLILAIVGIGVVGCKKDDLTYESKSSKPFTSSSNYEKAVGPWLPIIWVIIVLSEGQKDNGSTTTNPDGTVTIDHGGCSGIGTCAGSIAYDGKDIGSLNGYNYSPDYSIQAGIGLSDENEILLMVNNSEDQAERFFYSDSIYFLSDEYVVDQQNVLDKLNIESPFTVQPGKYKVHEKNEYKYIVIGKN